MLDHRVGYGSLIMLTVAALLAVAGLATAPAGAVEYGCIAVGDSDQPALYLEFKGKELRMASSLDGLASAKPIKATKMDSYEMEPGETMVWYQFPEVALPISMEGVSNLKGQFSLNRVQQVGRKTRARSESMTASGFTMSCRMEKKGAGGAAWTYVFYIHATVAGKQNDVANNIARLLNLDKITLAIETKIEGKKARIGLRASTPGRPHIQEQLFLQEVLKNGKLARATMEVTDKDGKVVHTQKGDLKKFGFT